MASTVTSAPFTTPAVTPRPDERAPTPVTKRRLSILALLIAAGLAVATLPAAAASTVVLHYSGTEKAGTTVANDTSGHDNDGTLHGVKTTGSAYQFNPTTSYIRVAASTSIDPGRLNYSYTVSINIPTSTVFTHDFSLVRRGSSKFAGPYYKMEMVFNRTTHNMRLECAFRDSTRAHESVSTSGNTLNDGVWHTLTCTKTRRTVSLTKDGVVHAKPAVLGNLSSTQPLFFGAEHVGPTIFWEHFPGRMRKITITKG
ncbi:MAG: hypothetical protein QOK30_3285 [Nocardioidaceae bacterium]|nr:hypothetical protein [Nocardioidaceae bacterium]